MGRKEMRRKEVEMIPTLQVILMDLLKLLQEFSL